MRDRGRVHVLLVEDDTAIATPLAKGLQREGLTVTRVGTGIGALELLATVDLVLLDLGLPDIDGYDVCRRIRAASTVPIIVVTARGEEVDRVVGLELGADDYVVKPFGFRELVARIRAVTPAHGGAPAAGDPESRTVGALVIDRRTHRRVTLDGERARAHAQGVRPARAARGGPGGGGGAGGDDPRGGLGPALVRTDQDARRPRRRRCARSSAIPGWIETVRGVGFRLRAP